MACGRAGGGRERVDEQAADTQHETPALPCVRKRPGGRASSRDQRTARWAGHNEEGNPRTNLQPFECGLNRSRTPTVVARW